MTLHQVAVTVTNVHRVSGYRISGMNRLLVQLGIHWRVNADTPRCEICAFSVYMKALVY